MTQKIYECGVTCRAVRIVVETIVRIFVPVGINTRSPEQILRTERHTCTNMSFQQGRIDEVGSLDHSSIESHSVAAWNGERDRIGLELGFHAPVATDMIHEHDAGKLTVNLVVEIAGNEPAGIEDGDR